jgi:hypothetical protein
MQCAHRPSVLSTLLPSLLVAAAVPACVNAVVDDNDAALFLDKHGVTKPEAWSASDAPSLFAANLNYRFAELPTTGEAARIPWAGSYWPVHEDSLNVRWDGADSEPPSTKYARAFGVTGVEDAISRSNGIDSQAARTKCTTENAATKCKAELGEQCAIRPGKAEGTCIPTWFGLCHAWAPAAILVPEPRRPVTRNGVTFKVNDLKALASLVHEGVSTKFVSLRCNLDDRTGADEEHDVDFDEHGRPTERACRDSNAGSFHVLLTNYLGVQRASFVFDRTYDDEVWNQPLRGYNVRETRELTIADANRLLGVANAGGTAGAGSATTQPTTQPTTQTTTQTAAVAANAWQHFAPVTVVAGLPFSVAMTGSGDGDLYVAFGAQPTTSSYACRPYSDGSAETCSLTVPAGATQAFVSVHGYSAADVSVAITTTTAASAGPGTTAPAYPFNAAAKKLQYVKVDVHYIAESATSLDGNLQGQIDRFTHTDRYEYVLELDGDGKIIGGEWVGASKRLHPDFAWLPTGVTRTTAAGGKVRYADVKSLLDESIAESGTTTTPQTHTETFTVRAGEWRSFGPFDVAAGGSFVAELTGAGDADLYVRKGSAPTDSTYDCRPYADNSTETCTVPGGGPVFVGVHGYAASSAVTVTLRWTPASGAPAPAPAPTPPAPTPPAPTPPAPTPAHLDVSGTLAQGAWAYHTIAVVAGRPVFLRTTAPHDVDLYVQMGTNPTSSNALARAYTTSGNEQLRIVPSSSGTLHIGVHGYAASSYRLVTADQ